MKKKIQFLAIILLGGFIGYLGWMDFLFTNLAKYLSNFYWKDDEWGRLVNREDFSKVKTFKCFLDKEVSTDITRNDKVTPVIIHFWPEIKSVRSDQSVFFIENIDLKNGTARIPGDTPTEGQVVYNEEGYTFFEKSISGNYAITTIFSPFGFNKTTDTSKFIVVTSGHYNLSDSLLSDKAGWASQYYGTCIVTEIYK